MNFNKLNKALCLMAPFSPIATLKVGSKVYCTSTYTEETLRAGFKGGPKSHPWLSGGTKCSGLPGIVLVFASGPNIVINRTSFYSQYCPSLDNKLP